MPLKAKVSALLLLAFSIGYTIWYLAAPLVVTLLLAAIAVAAGSYIITRPTARR